MHRVKALLVGSGGAAKYQNLARYAIADYIWSR